MNRFVLDASLSMAWFVPDPEWEYATQVRGHLAAEATALVPAIWPVEMANALTKAVRRGTITDEEADRGLSQLAILIISGPRIAIDPHFQPVWKAYAVARKHQVSAYDGCYLQLALDQGLPLATLDKGLRVAAGKAGVKLLK